uniref:Large ribosomal subunit protein uL11m n=1 Tax=Trichuris muris TaxID=70415 RepID=A0A5S6QEA7_TRIMR
MSKVGSAVKRLARKEAKKVVHNPLLRVTIPAQKASASPPLGPQVGERGLNAVQFAKDFNKATEHIIEGVPVPTRVHINPDRTYKIQFTTPPIPWLLKQAAGITKGSFHGDVSGMVTLKHVYEIAKLKQQDDVNMGAPMKRLCQIVMAYARTCGIEVRMEIDPAEYRQFLQEREEFVKKELEDLQAKRQAKMLRTA